MKPVTAVTANYLERMADPASRFHVDYVAYRNKQISRARLVRRLPHIAMVGDSLSRDAYISSALGTFWRAHTRAGNDWFLNSDSAPGSIYSIFRRLEEFTPLVATEYGGMGALVDNERDRQNFFRKVLRTRNFSAQADQLLSRDRFPDLILIWIGHNNVDWAWRCPPDELAQPEKRLQRIRERFRQDYTRQMERLTARARAGKHRVAIVVYGLADFESFFEAREIAEALRKQDSRLYPYLGADFKYFVSMQPPYRNDLLRLVRMVNEELRAMVSELNRGLEDAPNVQVRYSEALAKVDLSRVDVIHAVDGWHPSTEGHSAFSEAAFNDLGPSLEFLGIAT
jgi:lysophospholipase L1-like esterase